MSTIQRFEDLIAWQKARSLASRVYRMTDEGGFTRDWGFRDQIRNAALSVSSNIAEGFERGGLREFHQYLSTAKASCAEVRSQSYVATDVGHLTEADGAALRECCFEVGRIIGGLRRSVEKQLERRGQGRRWQSPKSTQDSGLRTQD